MRFELTILGSNAAVPSPERGSSAQFLRTETEDFLIDCGEGTQVSLLRFGFGLNRCAHILISHLHGDHYFGLPGLITSLSLTGRKKPLTIHSPPGLRDRLSPMLELDRYAPPYPLEFREFTATEKTLLFSTKKTEVYTFPLQHRVPCNGYQIAERERPRNILADQIEAYDIPYQLIPGIKAGDDLTLEDGTVIPNADLTIAPAPRRTYAYCSDTLYFPKLADYVRGTDLLYHEATFLHEMVEDAHKKGHATATEAARVARDAGAKTLLMGHFSARYDRLEDFEREARVLFPESHAVRDGWRYAVALSR